jgi:hypothetical protein
MVFDVTDFVLLLAKVLLVTLPFFKKLCSEIIPNPFYAVFAFVEAVFSKTLTLYTLESLVSYLVSSTSSMILSDFFNVYFLSVFLKLIFENYESGKTTSTTSDDRKSFKDFSGN